MNTRKISIILEILVGIFSIADIIIACITNSATVAGLVCTDIVVIIDSALIIKLLSEAKND